MSCACVVVYGYAHSSYQRVLAKIKHHSFLKVEPEMLVSTDCCTMDRCISRTFAYPQAEVDVPRSSRSAVPLPKAVLGVSDSYCRVTCPQQNSRASSYRCE